MTAMDLVVFAWRLVQLPSVRDHHGYFRHDHLEFEQTAGREEWRSSVNEILARNGVALRQEPDGRVLRVGTASAAAVTSRALPPSGDATLDDKIVVALRRYHDADPAVRREALEAIWDAFERVKSILDPADKKRSVERLIAEMASDAPTQSALDQEFRDLTRIGNDFQIRHLEVAKHPVPDGVVDLWFVRALSIVETAVRAIT
ncbi:MAG: hypothetical protein ACRD0G_02310 [Acidimicrobiales bacterium]